MNPLARTLSAFRSDKGLKGQLLRGGVGSMAIKVSSTGLNLVLAIVLARLLGAEGFGVYSFIFALVTILAVPAQMGLPNLVVRETAKAQVAERWDTIKDLWRWSSFIALVVSATLIVLGGIASLIFAEHLTVLQQQTFWWALILIPLIALGNLRGAALRGLRHVLQGQMPEFILRPFFLIVLAFVYISLPWSKSLSAADAMMLQVWAALAAFLIGAVLLNNRSSQVLGAGKSDQNQKYLWFASALPLAFIEGSHAINQNVGQIFLGLSAEEAEAGLLRLGIQISTFVAFGVLATDAVAAPYIARFFNSGDRRKLSHLVKAVANISAIIAFAIFLIFLVFGANFIEYAFGSEFERVAMITLILSISQLVNAATGPSGIFLTMCGDERFVFRALLISVLVNCGLLVALVPTYGSIGAATSLSIAFSAWNVMLAVYAWTKHGLNCSIIPLREKSPN